MHARYAGVNTYGYIWTNGIRDCLAGLAARGFRLFEGVINPPHLDLDMPLAQRREMGDFMRDIGASFCSLNLPSLDTNLASPFSRAREYSVDMFRLAIDLAADLGASRLVVVPGRLNPLLPPGKAPLQAWLQETIGRLIPHARDRSVVLAIENVPFAALPLAQDLIRFMDAMGNDDVLGVCYDVANAHFVGESPSEGLALLDGRLSLVHCSDTTRSAWRHSSIGSGDVPWREFSAALQGSSYRGPILLEIIDPDGEDAIVRSHDALDRLGVFQGRKS